MRAARRTAALAALALLAAPARAQAPDDLAPLGDEFDRAESLAGWTLHHRVEGWSDKLKVVDVDRTRPGSLYLEPRPSVWFYDYTAPFLFREVEGDFMVTARVRVTGTESPYPRTLFSLAGLMARRPRAGAPFRSEEQWEKDREDYVFLVTGTTRTPAPFIETKSAVRSKPLVRHYPLAAAGWVELRMVRLGRTFLLLFRPDGGEWTPHERMDRPDLTGRVQVGIMAYGDFGTIEERHWYRPWEYNTGVVRDGKEDLRVEVDWIRFRRPAPPEGAAAWVAERNLTWSDHRVSNEHLRVLLPQLFET